MGYFFLDALKTEKLYIEAAKVISTELKIARRNNLEFKKNYTQKSYDIKYNERVLISYLEKIEGRKTWLVILLQVILFLSFIQLSYCIYVAFIEKHMNSNQVTLLALAFLVSLMISLYLLWEQNQYKRNKQVAFKLFLEVRDYNFKSIQEEIDRIHNPKKAYPKDSPMDMLFGED